MSVLAPLQHRPFLLLLAGRAIDTLGNAIVPIALAFAVLDLTGSASDLGLVVGARTVVNVAFLLFGGVLADRLPRPLLMVGSCVAAAATQAVVAALVLTGTATIPLLIAFSAINGMAGALALPASAAILPQTVPAELRQQANGLNRMAWSTAMVIGGPLAGVLVVTVGPGWGIAVDAATFLLAALCFALLRLPEGLPETAAAGPAARTDVLTDLRTGWSEFRSRTWLWVVVAAFAVLNGCSSGAIFVLGPVVADDTIGRQAWGFVLASVTVGTFAGALIAIRLRLRRLLLFGAVCSFALALPVFVLAVRPNLVALVAAGLLTGVMMEQFGIAWETTMQEHIPADKLARVYSYDMVGSFVAIPVGQIAVGPVSQAIGVRPTLIGAAVLMTLAVIFMLSSRDVRTLRHKVPEPAAVPVGESVA
ncbi:MFS transporter [Micromonosporaceae bacterium Da 78-11]